MSNGGFKKRKRGSKSDLMYKSKKKIKVKKSKKAMIMSPRHFGSGKFKV